VLREPGGWRALYGVTALALAVHIAGDLITSFGTMILAPLSDWRAGLGTTFIIDLWFSGIIVAGLLISLILRRQRWPAIAASVLLCGYVGFQYLQKQRAMEFGVEYAKSIALRDALVTVQPRPVSPFNWTVFVSDLEAHRFAHVNLIRKEARRYAPGDGFIARVDSPYLPLDQAVWVTRRRYGETDNETIRDAWNSEAIGFFRWFAALPAFDGMTEGSTCVWFTDLRFLTPGREGMPFRYRVCRERPALPWRLVIS
jgi:inner membrane protein